MSKDVEIANIKEAMNGADNTKMITPYSLNQVIKRKAGSGSGTPGVGLNYYWNGTELGVKREDEEDYKFVDLQGLAGSDGAPGAAGKNLEFNWQGTSLGIRQEGETEYTYVQLLGATGPRGYPGIVAQDEQPEDTNLIWLDTDDDTVAYDRASQAEAEAGTDNEKYMTPLRVAQAIAALVGENIPDDIVSSSGSVDTLANIWCGTQAQYDAIVTKSDTTLYFIK